RFVRGGDDPRIHLDWRVAAHSFECARLQHAQYLSLGRRGHVADFIQKERPAVALLEFPDPLQGRAGKSSALVAEQLAFQKLLWNRGAVNRQERLLAPLAVVIN